MKIAVIGTGKTGSEVLSAASLKHTATGFSRKNMPNAAILREFDLGIIFIPAQSFADLASQFLAAKIPLVIGTTGFAFEKLPAPSAPWITASNFSLGMNAMFLLSQTLAGLNKMSDASFHVHEIHHTGKKDSPSGTALHLLKLLPSGTQISAERVGDVRGMHSLEIKLPGESLRFIHEAQNRSVFAQGALYAAETLLPGLAPGIHSFETLFTNKIRKDLSHA